MKRLFLIAVIYYSFTIQTAAQQNWAAVPCSYMSEVAAINKMFVDSLHNEIILYSLNGYKVCNTNFKGMFAYNGNTFHDLDRGINTHNSNLTVGGGLLFDCITYGNKTLFGGAFYSVGTNTLYTKGIALWNGAVWDTFPTRCFDNTPSSSSGGAFFGFLKHNSKLWMYGGFDTVGNTISKNIVAYDGNTFTAVPTIPVNDKRPITKMIVYKNKLIAVGNFDDYPVSSNMSRVAQFDGTSWSSVGSGVQGGLSNVCDMAVYKDTLYIAGAFPKSAGNAGNSIMKWDGTHLMDAGFGDFCGYGAIWNLVKFKNRLYAFGGFTCAADQKTFGMAYYENGKWTVSQDSVDNLITSAVLYNDAIYIGGAFKSINGDTSIHKFAKLMCPDFDAASGCVVGLRERAGFLDVKLFPNPTNSEINLEFDQSSSIDKISVINVLGQELYILQNPSNKQKIDVSKLPPGIYFIKAQNHKKSGIYKIIKE